MSDMLQTFNNVLTSPDQDMDPLNDSYIVLIPKKEGAIEIQDFRSISLLNSMQKCFSKLLANRLQNKMQHLILTAQP
jgi:hypothetical protein